MNRLWDDWLNGRGPQLPEYTDFGNPEYYANSLRGGLDQYRLKGEAADPGTVEIHP